MNHRNNFLKSVIVLDVETTGNDTSFADIIEVAGLKFNNQDWVVEELLLGNNNGISPDISAINHITNRMIHGKPTFSDMFDQILKILPINNYSYYVAHNSQFDQKFLIKSYLLCGDIGIKYAEILSNRTKWICTYRLSMKLFDTDFPDIKYGLSNLRYRFELSIPDGTSIHRAGGDALVCANLLEFLVDYAIESGKIIDNNMIGEQLFELCWKPISKTKWPFGKHKGVLLTDIPLDYFNWAISNIDFLNDTKSEYDADLAESVRAELERRLT